MYNEASYCNYVLEDEEEGARRRLLPSEDSSLLFTTVPLRAIHRHHLQYYNNIATKRVDLEVKKNRYVHVCNSSGPNRRFKRKTIE
jgi:hypothetical protein